MPLARPRTGQYDGPVIIIVDYRMGNLGSIRNMFRKIGYDSEISSDSEAIHRADRLVLPGVGAFDNGMMHIADMGLLDVLNEAVLEKRIPILGICLGMQLLTRRSEEGDRPGLGWIDGETKRFRFEGLGDELRIPHMGWNTVTPTRTDSLFADMDPEAGYYFVHSYHVVCDDESETLGRTHYGYDFTCAVQKGNILGTQFHPEKSHRYGWQLLKSFVELV